jgi:uncharacterized protein (DUF779 family)
MAVITISAAGASRLAEFAARPGGNAFKIDNGCCGGTTLLFMERRFIGTGDVLVGEVEGVGIYVERALRTSYETDTYHLDVEEGTRESGFSIEIPYGFKFVMHRTVSAGAPDSAVGTDS